jgi:hypothetical protein
MKKNLFIAIIFGIFGFGFVSTLNAQQPSQQVVIHDVLPTAPSPVSPAKNFNLLLVGSWRYDGQKKSENWNFIVDRPKKKENMELFGGRIVLLWGLAAQSYTGHVFPYSYDGYDRFAWNERGNYYFHHHGIVFLFPRK